jgi:small subunit ribosomal protein S4
MGETMARYRGPKNRIARKFGANIFGRARNPLLHKPNPPGMHGAKRKKKSDYGVQLEEKQKLKAVYGMLSEKQLLRAYKQALRSKENTANIFLELLETRLDNVVHRLRLGNTIFASHQLISHGHILVDGKKVDRRSFIVKPGMTISIKPKSQTIKAVQESIQNTAKEVPEYLSLDEKKFSGQLLSMPLPEQIPLALVINLPLVCEFLAHSC